VVLVIAAIVSVLVATRHGPDLGPDSVTYISAARNLVHGRGFTDFTDEPLTVFAPGYPAILSIGHFVGAGAASVGRFANALVVGAIALVSFFLLRRHVASPWVTVGAAALAALSGELLRIAAYVATDPLFVLLTLVFIILMEDIRTKPELRGLLIVLAGLVASVAFLVRYAAVPLFVSGVIVLAASSAKDGWGAVARRTISFAAISSIAPGLWLLRNATSGASDVLGVRVRTDDTPLTLARLLGEAAKDLVFSYRVPIVAALGAVVGGLVLAGLLAWRSRRDLQPRLSSSASAMLPILTLIVVSILFVVITHKTTGSDLNARMLLPVWVPAIILGAWFLDNLLSAGRKTGHERLVRLLSVVMVAFLVGRWSCSSNRSRRARATLSIIRAGTSRSSGRRPSASRHQRRCSATILGAYTSRPADNRCSSRPLRSDRASATGRSAWTPSSTRSAPGRPSCCGSTTAPPRRTARSYKHFEVAPRSR
jgi:hypothetical protein